MLLDSIPLFHRILHNDNQRSVDILNKLIFIIKEELNNIPNHRHINYNNDKQVLIEQLMGLQNSLVSRFFNVDLANYINLYTAAFTGNVVSKYPIVNKEVWINGQPIVPSHIYAGKSPWYDSSSAYAKALAIRNTLSKNFYCFANHAKVVSTILPNIIQDQELTINSKVILSKASNSITSKSLCNAINQYFNETSVFAVYDERKIHLYGFNGANIIIDAKPTTYFKSGTTRGTISIISDKAFHVHDTAGIIGVQNNIKLCKLKRLNLSSKINSLIVFRNMRKKIKRHLHH